MKKTFLSITTAILLTGAFTSVFASDTTALTKATVKLIKENRTLTQEVMNVQKYNENLDSKIEQNKVQIKNIRDDHAAFLKNFEEVKGNISKVNTLSVGNTNLQKQLQDLTNKVSLLEQKSMASNQSLEKVAKDSTNVSNASVISQQELMLLKQNVERLQQQGLVNNKQVNTDSNVIQKLEQRLAILEGENKNLKIALDNQKIYSDAEIAAVKTKLERAKPVVMVQEKTEPCKGPNCSLDGDSEDIIKNFIK